MADKRVLRLIGDRTRSSVSEVTIRKSRLALICARASVKLRDVCVTWNMDICISEARTGLRSVRFSPCNNY